MNFSAFGGPFSGIHQFAAKFTHPDNSQSGTFSNVTNNMQQDLHGNRYNTNTNNFNQNHGSVPNTTTMQYSQNIPLPYATAPPQQTQNDHNHIFNNDNNKNNVIKTKMERDHRDDVVNQQILQNQNWLTSPNTTNTVDYSSHLLSATLPISIQHFLKYSETIKKENINNSTVVVNSGNLNLSALVDGSGGGSVGTTTSIPTTGTTGTVTGGGFNIKNDFLSLKNGVGNNLNLALSGMTNVGNALGVGNINNGNIGGNIVNGINNSIGGVISGVINGNIINGGLNHLLLDTTNNMHDSLMSTTTARQPTQATTATTTAMATISTGTTKTSATGKKKKKKQPKEKKQRPKPGEIRETKALDGSTIYCCPECQMVHPNRSFIEQHIVSHAVERRFVCDVCNAALKRKDHLTRHKLSHIPDRPHECNICLKSFKRKEQLTLHGVIHSGLKKHICPECQKGFYRKDHLRKHTRSHIARRVKSEVTSQNVNNAHGIGIQAS